MELTLSDKDRNLVLVADVAANQKPPDAGNSQMLNRRSDLTSFDDLLNLAPVEVDDRGSFIVVIGGEEYSVYLGTSMLSWSHRFGDDEVDHSWNAALGCWEADEVVGA